MISFRNVGLGARVAPLGIALCLGCAGRSEVGPAAEASAAALGEAAATEVEAAALEMTMAAQSGAMYSLLLHGVSMALDGDEYYAMAALTAPENRERFRSHADNMVDEARGMIERVGKMIEEPAEGADPQVMASMREVHQRAIAVVTAVQNRPSLDEMPTTPASAPPGAPPAVPARDPATPAATRDEGQRPGRADLLRSHVQMTHGGRMALTGSQYQMQAAISAAPDAPAVEQMASHGRDMVSSGASMVRESVLQGGEAMTPDPMADYTEALRGAMTSMMESVEQMRMPRPMR